MTYIIEVNDDNGDIIDAHYACGRWCAEDVADRLDVEGLEQVHEVHGHESDSDTYCAACGTLLALGLNTERTDCDWSCVPVVVGRAATDRPERCEHGEYVQVPTLPRQWEAEIIHPDTSGDLVWGDLDEVIDRLQAYRITSPDARIHMRSIA